MARHTKASGWTTRSMVMVSIYGKTVENIMANGNRTTCKGMESTSTPMALDMMVNISWTKKRVSVSITGLMAANTRAGGTKVSNMDLEPTSTMPKVRSSMDCGNMASE